MPSDLVFPQSHEPKGFSTLAMAQHAGNPEPIVRELLQNSLDAAKLASRGTRLDPAEVVFTINEHPRDAIPGLLSYERAFNAAVEGRTRPKTGNASPNEQQVIKRISDTLTRSSIRCLFCRDNGSGLGDVASVLFEGNSDKPSGGGSFGVGHMTTFAASDLRYVLYAGRADDRDVAGGHAVLAAHQMNGKLLSADGYYTRELDLFSMDTSRFNADVPDLFARQFEDMSDTGTIVCVTGFNDFRDDEDPSAAICRVAATNFLAAIQHGEFVVTVRDETKGTEHLVSRDTIEEILNRFSGQQRARAGWLAGGRAFAAWETVCSGVRLDVEDREGVEVWFRRTDGSKLFQRQVNVFRDGMWITYTAPQLTSNAFAGVHPFDAVVLLREGSLYNLVRDAETPEHREIEPQRLDAIDRQRLYDELRSIAHRLREEAGELSTLGEYIPPGFAVFDANVMREADVRPRYRPRPGRGEQEVTERGDGEDIEEHDPDRRNGTRRGSTRPAPGATAPVRTSYRTEVNASGMVAGLTLAWEPVGEGARSGLALRIRVASGSDETCDQPISADYQQLVAIVIDGQMHRPENQAFELALPSSQGVGTVWLANPLHDSTGIEVDVVYRRRPTSQENSR